MDRVQAAYYDVERRAAPTWGAGSVSLGQLAHVRCNMSGCSSAADSDIRDAQLGAPVRDMMPRTWSNALALQNKVGRVPVHHACVWQHELNLGHSWTLSTLLAV